MKQTPEKIFNKDRDRAIVGLNYRISQLEKVLNAFIHHVREYIVWKGDGEQFTKHQERKFEKRSVAKEEQKTQEQMDRTQSPL